MTTPKLLPPFPWFGGKGRAASMIWERLGNPDVYAEPFGGSLACLLARPRGEGKREVVCELDGGVVNFFRATTADPILVAKYADHPCFHADLTARHKWLRQWAFENAARLSEDPEYYDAQAAGWWVWGRSLWIGGGWCDVNDKQPDNETTPSLERIKSETPDQIPHIGSCAGGSGVNVQRMNRPNLADWFSRVSERLKSVIVLNRSWESALSDTLLMQAASSARNVSVGILMDPPYLTEDRSASLYQSDLAGTSDHAATASWEWSLEHGDRYRIAYCCHEGDIDVPDGWDSTTRGFRGINDVVRHEERQDMIVFSPACLHAQPSLFDV